MLSEFAAQEDPEEQVAPAAAHEAHEDGEQQAAAAHEDGEQQAAPAAADEDGEQQAAPNPRKP